VSLGRRFRALKLWMVMRAFGVEGIRDRLREPLRLAQLFRSWVEKDDRFEVVAPTPMAVVCFRARFPGRSGDEADRLNNELAEAVNATGEAFLSATRLRGRAVLRLAIGNIRTTDRHVARAWQLLQEIAASFAR
jgi:aromatic-L-amino-acid decarboxylase